MKVLITGFTGNLGSFTNTLVRAARILLLLVIAAAEAKGASSTAFWVWHRRDSLTSEERTAVSASDAKLFWHVGELALSGSTAQWRWREAMPPEVDAVPVVRIDLTGAAPFSQAALANTLVAMADKDGRLQIDCDCPDRLLGDYASFLVELRRRVPHLSATALAGWSEKPAFEDLQKAVESLAVMFYDLQPDPGQVNASSPPVALLDPTAFARRLARWDACRIPWLAGLPNFSRVTLYDSSGHFLGHVRNWRWDELVFQPRLKFETAPSPVTIMLRAAADCMLADVPVKSGALVAVRWAECESLAQGLDLVRKSHASGVAWFRFPDSSDASGWSVAQLRELRSKPSLRLRVATPAEDGTPGSFVLSNDSAADIPPRLQGDGPGDRGYALEIDAPEPVWREALPGDFWRVGAHADPENHPRPAALPFATRLTFWFSHLRAGEKLKTGLIQLAPGASFRQLRYRILPGDLAWKSID